MKELTAIQTRVLGVFASTSESEHFYMTGGTALAAFYLNHRISEDLDLFTPEERLVGYMGDRFKGNLEKEGFEVKVIRRFQSFYEMVVGMRGESVRIQLAFDSPFHFEEPWESEIGVKVDSLIDIATNKLLALYGRSEIKGFCRCIFLIKEKGLTIEELIEKAKQKDLGLDTYYLAIAFERVKEFPQDLGKLPVVLLKPLDIADMKEFFVKEALDLLERRRQ